VSEEDREKQFPTEDELWEKTKSTDPREKAEALYALGHQAMHRNDWDAVAAFHAAEAEILLEINDPEYTRALVMQGLALDSAGRTEESLDIMNQALEHGRATVGETLLGEISLSVAGLLSTMGRTDEAIKRIQSSIELFVSSEAFDRAGHALLEEGDLHARTAAYAQSQNCYERSMTNFQRCAQSSMFGRARDRLASALVDQGKNGEAMPYLRDNVDLYDFLGEDERLMFAKYRVGWNLLALDKPHEALALLQEARAFYQATHDLGTVADIDAHIVDALRALGNYSEAENIARQMRAFFESTNNVARLLVSDINRAKAALALGDDGQAEELLWNIINQAQHSGFSKHARTARLLLAEFFASNDAFQQATSALGDSQPEDWGENYAKRCGHLNVLARISLGTNDALHAGNLAKKIIELASMYDIYAENARAHMVLADIAEHNKNFPEAKSLRAQAVALFLAAGCDDEARRVSKQLLPGSGSAQSEFEDHRDDMPVREDTGPLETITEGVRPEWIERAGWIERFGS
jgi:tetratricopeptide (TPR) repeat protein